MHSFDTRWQGQGNDDREHRGGGDLDDCISWCSRNSLFEYINANENLGWGERLLLYLIFSA